MPIACGEILVLGIGKSLLEDEGIGVHAKGAVAQNGVHIPGLHCLDGGMLSFSLASDIGSCDRLIVLDATELQAVRRNSSLRRSGIDELLGVNRKRGVHDVELLTITARARRAFMQVPREAVAHWIVIRNGKVTNYQGCSTEHWNADRTIRLGTTALMKSRSRNMCCKILPGRSIFFEPFHSFDPFVACADHVVDPQIEELIRVKVR